MKKKNINLNRLTLNKATIARLAHQQQAVIQGGATQEIDTCISSLPPTRIQCPPTMVPVTQPCGTQACGTTSV